MHCFYLCRTVSKKGFYKEPQTTSPLQPHIFTSHLHQISAPLLPCDRREIQIREMKWFLNEEEIFYLVTINSAVSLVSP